MKKRIVYFDTVKFIAISWIFFCHFLDSFAADFPWPSFLYGISGKAALAALSVLLGYFAYLVGTNSQRSLVDLTVKRYLAFFMAGLSINLICSICALVFKEECPYRYLGIKAILQNSLCIGDGIFETFWCMKSFFFGSVISYLNGKYKIDIIGIVLEIIVFASLNVWIAICIMGNVVFLINSEEEKPSGWKAAIQRLINRPLVQCLLCVVVYFIIRRPESRLTYFIDGISSVLILLVISHNRFARSLLEFKPIAYFARYSEGVFLLHPVVYQIAGAKLIKLLLDRDVRFRAAFIVSFAVCYFATVLLSVWMVKGLDQMTNLSFNGYLKMKSVFFSRLKDRNTANI